MVETAPCLTTFVDMMITILHITISSGMEAAKEVTELVLMEEQEANKECMVSLIRAMVCRRKQHMTSTQLHLQTWVDTGHNRTRLQRGIAPQAVLQAMGVQDLRSRERISNNTPEVSELLVESLTFLVAHKRVIRARIKALSNKEAANRLVATRLHAVTETLRRLREDRVPFPVRRVAVLALRRITCKVRQACHHPKARAMRTTAINLKSTPRCTGSKPRNTVLVSVVLAGIIRLVAKILKPADTVEDMAAHSVGIIMETTTAVAGAGTTGTDNLLPTSMLLVSVRGVGHFICLATEQINIRSA